MLQILNGMVSPNQGERDRRRLSSKDKKMLLESKSMKSKILTSAMEVDEDYRRFTTTLGRDIKFRTTVE
jgi:hypothetical protein